MRFFTILLGIGVVLSVASATANACRCAGRSPVCESFGTADAVFVGTVIGVAENKPSSNPNVVELGSRGL